MLGEGQVCPVGRIRFVLMLQRLAALQHVLIYEENWMLHDYRLFPGSEWAFGGAVPMHITIICPCTVKSKCVQPLFDRNVCIFMLIKTVCSSDPNPN